MKNLEQLQEAKHLNDLAKLLGFKSSALSYIIYKMNDSEKYKKFEIPKKSSLEKRVIHAPNEKLSLLQKRLAKLLNNCVLEIKEKENKYWLASHGYQKQQSILTNSKMHTKKKYVFNIDLMDFFGAINFGRVRGFFANDHHFSLDHKIATIIAQIACYNNKLPQGSSCSPVISNLIGDKLDKNLLHLAFEARCNYTRYVDDLTFSTNLDEFPFIIAEIVDGSWKIGRKLEYEINKCGFQVNYSKIRMNIYKKRQVVTGITVNKKINTSIDYYRKMRSMCHSLFVNGSFYLDNYEKDKGKYKLKNLEGKLSHLCNIKSAKINDDGKIVNDFSKLSLGPKKLYKNFLFYKNFIALESPLVVLENPLCITYFKFILRSREGFVKNLSKSHEICNKIGVLNSTNITRNILELTKNFKQLITFIETYSTNIDYFYTKNMMKYPVIVVLERRMLRSEISKISANKIRCSSNSNIYFCNENLYIIDNAVDGKFYDRLMTSEVNRKVFEEANKDQKNVAKILKNNNEKIDFSIFDDMLINICRCIFHYERKRKNIDIGNKSL